MRILGMALGCARARLEWKARSWVVVRGGWDGAGEELLRSVLFVVGIKGGYLAGIQQTLAAQMLDHL